MKIFARTKFKDEPFVTVIGDTKDENAKNDAQGQYTTPNVPFETEFKMPWYNLDDGEWFFIEPREDNKEALLGEYLSASESMSSLNPIKSEYYDLVDCIFGVEGNKIVFTKITPSYVIKNQYVIEALGVGDLKQPQIKKRVKAIEFNPSKVDAYYNGDNNRLYFRRYNTVNSLFPGISEYYRDANENEIQNFLDLELFDTDENISPSKINSHTAKRIATIADDKDIDPDNETFKENALSFVKTVGKKTLGIEVINKKIKLQENKDVRTVCDVLLGNIYVSPITNDSRRTTGNIKLNAGSDKVS